MVDLIRAHWDIANYHLQNANTIFGLKGRVD